MNTVNNTTVNASEVKADPVAVTILQLVRDSAAADEIKVVEALRGTLAAHPRVTRIGFKHAAIIAGINKYTARNTFDRVARGA